MSRESDSRCDVDDGIVFGPGSVRVFVKDDALVDAGLLVGLGGPFADPVNTSTPTESCRVGDKRSFLGGCLAL